MLPPARGSLQGSQGKCIKMAASITLEVERTWQRVREASNKWDMRAPPSSLA